MVRRSKVFAALAALPLLVVVVASCSNQAEGERCNTSEDDCQSGLVCTIVSATGSVSADGFCCPTDTSTSSSANCRLQNTQTGNNPAPDASAEPTDAAVTTDATTSTDGGSPTDAGTD